MSNEAVVLFVLGIVLAFSLWLGSGIVLLKKMLERIELAMLKKQPQIVRCKDCKHWESEDGKFGICKICHSVSSSNGWFCADGERK